MKFNIIGIFFDHLSTLYDASTDKTSIFDLFLFYIFPLIISYIFFALEIEFKPDVYSLSITFYGIFLALLLNIQVAIFAIFQRTWSDLGDQRIDEKRKSDLKMRKTLLSEINSNISYMTALSCIYLSVFLIVYALEIKNYLVSSILIYFYTHFILTFLMVVKRAHALFSKEYDN